MLNTRIVDIYDTSGAHIVAYTVCLEDAECHDCEFEEVALVFAERSGKVAATDLRGLIARCHREI